jgi:Fe-S cluster assembly ATPase SufC
VKDLTAKIAATGQQILKGVTLTVREGEVHAIMGKNGSGKSTLSKVLVGHPDYEVTGGTAVYKGQNLFDLAPEERSHAGLFLSFQSPIEIPGVSNVDFLRLAANARRKAQGQAELDPLEFYAYIMPKVCSPFSFGGEARRPFKWHALGEIHVVFKPAVNALMTVFCLCTAGPAQDGSDVPQQKRQRGLLGRREEAQ